MSGTKFIVIGHRGAAGISPENTLPSFATAWRLGCTWIELDVHNTKDGDLAVIHDASLQRTTGRDGLVGDLIAAELTEYDAGNGAHIPTLAEVFALALNTASSPAINIELKGAGTASTVAQFLKARPAACQKVGLLVSSFDHDELRAFRELDENTCVAPLFSSWDNGWQLIAMELRAGAVNLSRRACTRDRIRSIRGAGLEVFVYTVNSVREAKTLEAYGVSGVFTDRPDRLLRAWHARQGSA